jgi:transposase
VAGFRVDWERRVVTCPEGRQSVSWSEMTTVRGRRMVGVHVVVAGCQACPARSKCMRAKAVFHSLLLQSREEHEVIQEARRRQETKESKDVDGRRAGIEGKVSPGVRAFGLRRARYRGLIRTHVQHVATAAAINVGRLTKGLNGLTPISTRHSRFAAFATAS